MLLELWTAKCVGGTPATGTLPRLLHIMLPALAYNPSCSLLIPLVAITLLTSMHVFIACHPLVHPGMCIAVLVPGEIGMNDQLGALVTALPVQARALTMLLSIP